MKPFQVAMILTNFHNVGTMVIVAYVVLIYSSKSLVRWVSEIINISQQRQIMRKVIDQEAQCHNHVHPYRAQVQSNLCMWTAKQGFSFQNKTISNVDIVTVI